MSNLENFPKNRKINQIYTRGEKKNPEFSQFFFRRNDKICNLDEEAFEY